MLFSNQRRHSLEIPARDDKGKAVTIASLIDHLCKHTMKDQRKEFFVLDHHLYVLAPPSGTVPPHWLSALSAPFSSGACYREQTRKCKWTA